MSSTIRFRRGAVYALAGVALAAVATGVFYARSPSAGKSDCAPISQDLAQKLKTLAKGDMAALRFSAKPPPPIAFHAADGAPLTLAAFAGRALVVNLWATWCVPCRAEMPALDRLQAEAGGADFEVAAINVDTAHPERAPAFLATLGVKALKGYADSSGAALEKAQLAGDALGLPTTLIIDRRGCELGVLAGAAKWDSAEALALVKALAGG